MEKNEFREKYAQLEIAKMFAKTVEEKDIIKLKIKKLEKQYKEILVKERLLEKNGGREK